MRSLILAFAALVTFQASPLHAENMDAAGVKIYAWSENAGWVNAQPQGPGASGMQVNDFDVRGWLWGENTGWISLSCRNLGTCATTSYGVANDGNGVLSGYAWSENAGWIDFGASTSGVTIAPATGIFNGYAWSENLGWISFQSAVTNPFQVMTQWRCSPAPPHPTGSPSLTIGKSGADAALAWTAITGSTGYDAVRGDLGTLRTTHSFQSATQQCLGNNRVDLSLTYAGTPAVGAGWWFLVRGVNCGGAGTYDEGTSSQSGSRDAGITASGVACP